MERKSELIEMYGAPERVSELIGNLQADLVERCHELTREDVADYHLLLRLVRNHVAGHPE